MIKHKTMKTKTILVLIAAFAFAFTSCDKVVNPSGNITEMEHKFSEFTAIDISDAFQAYVNVASETDYIVVEADHNIHEYIDIKKIDDRLYIGIERNFNISGPATLKAYIYTSSDIAGLYASEASLINMTGEVAGNYLRAEASGASRIVGAVDVNTLSADLSGASSFELSGTADNLTAKLSGASTMGGYELAAQDLEIGLSGASNARLTVEGTLDVTASGASSMLYKGDGTVVRSDLSGGSQIVKID
jgi:hypothetical protein